VFAAGMWGSDWQLAAHVPWPPGYDAWLVKLFGRSDLYFVYVADPGQVPTIHSSYVALGHYPHCTYPYPIQPD